MQRNNRIKIGGLILLVFLGMNAFSQHNTTSPYSRFGIGDLVGSGKGRSVAMGGAGIALSTPYALNSLNPASYGVLDSLSFIYEIGLNAHISNYKTELGKHNTKDANFDYFSIAFPVTNWWRVSAGITPYSNVGYFMDSKQAMNDSSGDFLFNKQFTYEGKGGVNKAYFSQSFVPVKDLYLGVNFSYVFGQVTKTKMIDFLDKDGMKLPQYRSTKYEEQLSVKDIMFDFGVQYKKKLNDKYTISFGGIYAPEKTLSSDLDITSGTDITSNTANFVIPTKFGGGLGLYINDNMTLGFDYVNEQWSDVTPYVGSSFDNVGYKNNEKYALGFEIIPNRRALKSYLGVIAYRVGVHYTDSYLKIGNESVKDYGMSFGFGFPLRRSSTYVNVSLDLGRRGDIAKTYVQEDYAKLSISFSMFSRWFYKRKYE